MIVLIFLAMGLSSENKSTSHTQDCAYLRQQCQSDGTACEHAWRIVEDACGISDPGDSCKITNSSHCNLTIQCLVESNFQFKRCVYTDDLSCTVNKVFGIKCINKSDDIKEDKKFKQNLITPSHHGLAGVPSCLEATAACLGDAACNARLAAYLSACSAQRAGRRYWTFQSKCWPHVAEKCHEDETCISTLSKQDITCSGSEDCRAAYIGILGTALQGQCTCRATTQTEESLCKIFQQLLHRKSCFNYPILSNVKGIPFYNRKHAKEITLTGFHSRVNGEVIYAVMCMTVTCGVLLLVMLKLRISRIPSQTRDPPRIQIPGGIIIH
ncbi:PREDICTED: GDNF family receptor alpha-like [Chinchilla lanigera]|uniref:GDNF family receptor alpha-like n=1 Tax=Chinchilla lanigera TaxID=34839 RepID=UPI00038EA82D|nr:PREDICTED: GDNF family receptor alpha-like [Chinchilla lanigera]